MQTPPTSPQRQQHRTRQVLRDIRTVEDGSPHRRRVPASGAENIPPSSRAPSPTPRPRPNARSLAQAERRQQERQARAKEPPRVRQRKRPPRPAPEGPPTAQQLGQQRRRQREREERENRMSIDDRPPPSPSRTSNLRVLQALPNGLLERDPSLRRQRLMCATLIFAPVEDPPPNVQRGERGHNPANTALMIARREYHDPESWHDLGPMNVECPHCGALHWADERVAGSSKHALEFGIRCNHGKVQLERFGAPPEPLHRLLVGNDAQAQDFRHHITQYNAALAFALLGVSDDKHVNRYGPNAWVFRICLSRRTFDRTRAPPMKTGPSNILSPTWRRLHSSLPLRLPQRRRKVQPK
ncbi:hypothetical protein C8R47DRAFT_1145868 [Mycena vitilis]|nr:hypothetical protein C8R47DRAFT_1145868 [Mycena vitilis]